MNKILALGFSAAMLAACSREAGKAPEAPTPSPSPSAPACNSVAPDLTKPVSVIDAAAATLMSKDMLRGGPVTPGTYDLVSAVRIGSATGWSTPRAVALGVEETEAGLVLNWAGAEPGGAVDSWTATMTDGADAQVTYSCGRIGTVGAAFLAQGDTLELRVDDGANGALHMVFQRRT